MSDFTDKNPKWFYDSSEFLDLKVIEDNWSVILEELQNLRQHMQQGHWLETFPEYLKPNNGNKWKVFTFRLFGIRHMMNCGVCPKTAELLERVPSLVTAEFSYLPANTQIKPHTGFTKTLLRAHLGLVVPDHCGLRVGNETKTWEPGKIMIFDDSFEHEAWNNSTEDRFILMMDIPNPAWNYTAQEICRYKLETMQDEFMLKLFSREQWLHFLEIGRFDAAPGIT